MKKIIALIIMSAFVTTTAYAEAVVKKVCHVDAKTKKEVCKNIKTHKKLEGTAVPAPKKK